MSRATIPVHILTGFLGSGKTSLLNRALMSGLGPDTGVIVNEFGDVALDQLFIASRSDEVVVMKSGCVCCSIRTDLAGALMDLAGATANGSAPLRRVIIETSGLSAPEPILTTLRSDFNLLSRFHIGSIACAVDATGLENTRSRPETLAQVAAADVCLVTKCDLATDEAVARTRAWIRAVNPIAIVRSGADDDVAAWFAEDGHQNARRVEAIALPKPMPLRADDGHGVGSIVVRASEPHSWPSFATWLSLLIHLHGDRILRMKGVLWDSGRQTWIAVHGVRRFLFPPEHIETVRSIADGACLVFITENLDPTLIEKSYCRWMASHGEYPGAGHEVPDGEPLSSGVSDQC